MSTHPGREDDDEADTAVRDRGAAAGVAGPAAAQDAYVIGVSAAMTGPAAANLRAGRSRR